MKNINTIQEKSRKNFPRKIPEKIRNLTIPLGSENAEGTRGPETDPNGIDQALLISCHFSVLYEPIKKNRWEGKHNPAEKQ